MLSSMSTSPTAPSTASGSALTRWLAVGRSADPDARAAGAAAVTDALEGRADARLLVVFCWAGHDLEALLEGIRGVAGDVPLIGCSTAGEIAASGPGDGGVVVTAIGGAGFSVATAAAEVVDGRLREASAEAAACIDAVEEREHRFLLLLTDGLVGDQEEIVRGAYSVVGASVPLVGGCAGDGLRMEGTFQLHDGRVLQHAVVAAAVASDAPFGIGVRHGWRRVGDPVVVTRSEGPVVHELDDQPALDVYLERLGAPPGTEADAATFAAYASTHPLGLPRRSGEEVRYVAGADFQARSITCIASVPQGGLAWFMEGDDRSVLDASDAACAAAVEALGDAPTLGLIAFDCIARRGVLGEEGIATEVQRIAEFAGGAPVAGFYTYGEIARTRGTNGFHNQTLVVLALA